MAGAFGNPLSAGIALQMDTNKIFNDERQLRLAEKKLDMGQEAARASQRKKDEKELAGILSKITSDDSKVWWRYQPQAQNSYARTIKDVSSLWQSGNYNEAMTTMQKHNNKMTGLLQATKVKDDWVKRAVKGDVYANNQFVNEIEDRGVDMTGLAKTGAETGYGIFDDASGIINFGSLTQKVPINSVYEEVAKLQGTTFERDPSNPDQLAVVATRGTGINKQDVGVTQTGTRENQIQGVLDSYRGNLPAMQGEAELILGWDGLKALEAKATTQKEYVDALKDVISTKVGTMWDESKKEQLFAKDNQGKAAVVKASTPQSRLGGRVSYSVNVNTLQSDDQEASWEAIADASSAATAAAEADPDKLYTKDGFAGTPLWTELNDLNYKMEWSNSNRTLTVIPPPDQDGQTRENEAREFDLRGGLLNTKNNTGIWNDINGFVGGTLKAQELPEDKQVIASNKTYTVMQSKESALYGKNNLITIPGGSTRKAILTGQNELQVIDNPNPFSIRGDVVQILDDMIIETEDLPDTHVFKKAYDDGLLEEDVDYALIEPSQQIEGDTPESLNWKKLKTGAAGEESYELMDSGIEISADGGHQILMPLTWQFKEYIQGRYGKTIDEMKKESRETIGR